MKVDKGMVNDDESGWKWGEIWWMMMKADESGISGEKKGWKWIKVWWMMMKADESGEKYVVWWCKRMKVG
jgi:hypothetical protein